MNPTSRLLLFCALSLLPASFSRAQAPGNDPFLKMGQHKVHPTRLIAKWRAPAAGNEVQAQKAGPSRVQALQQERITAPFAHLKEVVLLEPAVLPARSTQKPTSEQQLMALKQRQQELLASGQFEYVEFDWRVSIQRTPSDAGWSNGSLWGLNNYGQSGGTSGMDIGAEEGWDVTTGNRTIIVGVIDTGVRYTHQDLAANMWQNPGEIPGNGRDDDNNGYVDDVFGINAVNRSGDPMDDNGHGTHCAGTIGAVANGGGPHVGVAWDVQLMALKFLEADGSGSTSDAIRCIDYAISKNADILSNSWGGGGASNAMRDAIVRARQAGILFICAAGNESADNDQVGSFPANYDVDNVVSVASITRSGSLSGFSNYGRTTVDLAAPGSSIYSTWHTSNTAYRTISGTSMATPHVAGAAVLIKSQHPADTPAQLKQRLFMATRPLPALNGRMVTGGTLDISEGLTGAPDGTMEVSVSSPVSPLPAGQSSTITIRVSDFSPVTGATVQASHTGQSQVTFRDNGQSPDTQANDGTYTALYPIPSSGSTFTLNVTVNRSGKTPFSGGFPLAIQNRPSNDNFSNAANTTGSVSTGSNLFATSETNEPRNPSFAGGQSVWWTWVAPTSGQVTISTAGSNYDTTMAVYIGTSLNTLSLIGANDDVNGTLQSAVTFSAGASTRYWIQVDGYNRAAGSIQLNHPTSGSNDPSPRIITQPQGGTALEGSNYTFNVVASGASLSYQWRKDGAPIGGATSASYTLTNLQENLQGSYSVTVTNSFGNVTSSSAFLSVEQVVLLPDNDNFTDAYRLTGIQGRITGTTTTASGEPNEPNHGGNSSPLNSVWFSWAATVEGTLALNTNGSDFNTVLAVYTGTSLGNLNLVRSDDNSGEGLQSALSFTAQANTQYWIAVDGTGSNTGALSLSHGFTPSQTIGSADNFAQRLPVIGTSVQGNNVQATGEPGEPSHAGASLPLNSIWWYWIAPQDGQVSFDTIGSDFDTTLAVYVGGSVNSLTTVASNDDSAGYQSRVQFNVAQGTSYSIAVDGYDRETGNVQLNVSFLANDGNQYEFDPNFGSLLYLGPNRYFSDAYGTLAFANGGLNRASAWSSSMQVWLQGRNRRVTSPQLGKLTPGQDSQYVFSERFGWIHFGRDDQQYGGWIFSQDLEWMAFIWSGSSAFLYAPRLGNTYSVPRGQDRLLNLTWGNLTYLGPDRYQSSRFGTITIGEQDGWVRSSRFGWCWASGTEWVWSSRRQEWLGITPGGGIWSSAENRFL